MNRPRPACPDRCLDPRAILLGNILPLHPDDPVPYTKTRRASWVAHLGQYCPWLAREHVPYPSNGNSFRIQEKKSNRHRSQDGYEVITIVTK